MLPALYYPFSRCISTDSLKQMLLVFDRVHFLDPVSDEEWRAKLLRDREAQGEKRFAEYRELFPAMQTLMNEGVIARTDPAEIESAQHGTTAAGIVSDLLDPEWTEQASCPDAWRMPHLTRRNGAATWEIFPSKLPIQFATVLVENETLRQHLVRQEHGDAAWTLSYAAGSAAALNVHLAAAEELSLAPVTDSPMHHRLLLAKALREANAQRSRTRSPADRWVDSAAHQTAMALVKSLVPSARLAEVEFDQILTFRESTREVRRLLISDIKECLASMAGKAEPNDIVAAQSSAQTKLLADLKSYQLELGAARDKVWPSLVGALQQSLPAGSIAAVAMNLLGGGPSHLIATSVLGAALAILKSAVDVQVEVNRTRRSASPAVTFLAQLVDERFA